MNPQQYDDYSNKKKKIYKWSEILTPVKKHSQAMTMIRYAEMLEEEKETRNCAKRKMNLTESIISGRRNENIRNNE